jgi:hypothetical protein
MCIAPRERIDFHSLDLVLSRAANRGRFRHDAVIVEIPLQLATNRPKQLMQIEWSPRLHDGRDCAGTQSRWEIEEGVFTERWMTRTGRHGLNRS